MDSNGKWSRLLATLLHYANADAGSFRSDFYALKTRLLRRYASHVTDVIQEIKKECWGDKYDDWGDLVGGCRGKGCRRCGGSGIFDIRWITLQEWRWHHFTFHVPTSETRIRPDSHVSIYGRIEHRRYGRTSSEARMWLYLLCGEWRLLWRSLKGSHYCGKLSWHPFCNIQRIVMPLGMWLSWHKCFCGRKFPTFGSGWQICFQCRRKHVADDLPF